MVSQMPLLLRFKAEVKLIISEMTPNSALATPQTMSL